jgi:hypothetical protein
VPLRATLGGPDFPTVTLVFRPCYTGGAVGATSVVP